MLADASPPCERIQTTAVESSAAVERARAACERREKLMGTRERIGALLIPSAYVEPVDETGRRHKPA